MKTESSIFLEERLTVTNAGLVLLSSYILTLLQRLKAVTDNNFTSKEKQFDSVHYLQYIVTGLTKTNESILVLNNVICELSPNIPVRENAEMTEDEKKMIDGLIEAAIQHWSTSGSPSINIFRKNWLVRNGMLIETENCWKLTVKKRVYDILLLQSPFSPSIIKLPWMQKPLHVTW